MAGNIGSKVVHSIITLTTSGASLATGSAGAANGTADLDVRDSGGSGNAAGDLWARFELFSRWTTITGIIKNTTVGELYLVPKLDGTNAPDIDLTASTSAIPYACFAGVFVSPKQLVTVTDTRFVTRAILLEPLLYAPYLLNRSGQTNTANWTLKAFVYQRQYT